MGTEPPAGQTGGSVGGVGGTGAYPAASGGAADSGAAADAASDLFSGDDDANTPLTEEEREQLIPTHITLRRELNEVEQINVADAERWAFARSRDVLDSKFLKGLHKRMFGEVWRWAGTNRRSGKNIGIDPYRIDVELHQFLRDVRYWVEHQTYRADEIAARFHHRLVQIHIFPNGNGRHARLAADLLLAQLGEPPFTWGGAGLIEQGAVRKRYVAALKAADGHAIDDLAAFVRS